jgi:hypothetical protein
MLGLLDSSLWPISLSFWHFDLQGVQPMALSPTTCLQPAKHTSSAFRTAVRCPLSSAAGLSHRDLCSHSSSAHCSPPLSLASKAHQTMATVPQKRGQPVSPGLVSVLSCP